MTEGGSGWRPLLDSSNNEPELELEPVPVPVLPWEQEQGQGQEKPEPEPPPPPGTGDGEAGSRSSTAHKKTAARTELDGEVATRRSKSRVSVPWASGSASQSEERVYRSESRSDDAFDSQL